MSGSESSPTVGAVVVAAGRGDRFGGPKASLRIAGRPLWQIARDLMESRGIECVIVGDVPGGVAGGSRRRDSVANGLAALGDVDLVLVHDVARPLANAPLLGRVVRRLSEGDVDAVIPVVPVPDTLKRIDGDVVVETLDRANVVLVQTPQGFRRGALIDAHAAHPELDATDDAGLVELIGGRVGTVDGDPDNFKITWPDDLARAELVWARRNDD